MQSSQPSNSVGPEIASFGQNLDGKDLRVVLLEGIDPSALGVFVQAGLTQVVSISHAPTGAELLDLLRNTHLLGIRSRSQLNQEVLRSASKLMAIGCFCIGTSQVDLEAAARLGIPVFNAPFSNTRSVAELVLAQIIILLRGIPQRNADLHRGLWVKSSADSYEARGKTLGLVGYGHIGSQVGVLAEQLGMRVVFHDIEARMPFGNALAATSLEELLGQSDVISLHVPETPETVGLMGSDQLLAMKPGSHLINASRGCVVDIDALRLSLDSRHLHGAAIDVFPVEPSGDSKVFESPLRSFDNVILTPHIGGSTAEAQVNIGKEVADKLVRFAGNGGTMTSVNFPQVTLPAQGARNRLLHIHKNTPGVLAALNALLSQAGINICAQYLGTNNDVGYVVVDFESTANMPSMQALDGILGTIRCRLVYPTV